MIAMIFFLCNYIIDFKFQFVYDKFLVVPIYLYSFILK